MNDGQRAHVVERLKAGDSQADMVQYLMSEGVDESVATDAVRGVATTLPLPPVSTLLRDSWDFVLRRTDLVGWYVAILL